MLAWQWSHIRAQPPAVIEKAGKAVLATAIQFVGLVFLERRGGEADRPVEHGRRIAFHFGDERRIETGILQRLDRGEAIQPVGGLTEDHGTVHHRRHSIYLRPAMPPAIIARMAMTEPSARVEMPVKP